MSPTLRKGFVALAAMVLVAVAMLFVFAAPVQGPKVLPTSEFVAAVERDEIREVRMEGEAITGLTKTDEVVTTTDTERTALVSAMRAHNVKYTDIVPSRLGATMLTMLPFILLLLFGLWFMRKLLSGPGDMQKRMSTGSRTTIHEKVDTTFADVAGCDEAKASATKLVRYLKDPKALHKLGGKPPTGYLFVGPSGTGKTLLARAVAGEAGVPFIVASASSFVEMFVGMGAKRVSEMFDLARKHAPCIIFIDELDAVGKKRGGFSTGGHDEREQTLNELLTQMDGFEKNEGIIVIAATNRPEVLDSALLRPGRFSRKIVVPKPDIGGRRQILKVHARNKPLANAEEDLEKLARATPGMTGAELENVLNEAASLAEEKDLKAITFAELLEARDTEIAGEERKSAIISDDEKLVIAYHEAGHALVAWKTAYSDPTNRVTIIPRGMSLGSTWHIPGEDQNLQSRRQMIAKIKGLYGGRLAEQLVFGQEATTGGASSDLSRLKDIVRYMVEDVALGDSKDPQQTYGEKEEGMVFQNSTPDYGNITRNRLDEQKNALLARCEKEARDILVRHRDLLDLLASQLIERETLEEDDLKALLGPHTQGEKLRVIPAAAPPTA